MRVFLGIAIVLSAAACGDKAPTPPGGSTNKTHDVFTIGDHFVETPLRIAVGDTVRWNLSAGSDGDGHNVRFNPRLPGAPADIPETKGVRTSVFGTKGDFKYVCDIHPGMNGEIVVQ